MEHPLQQGFIKSKKIPFCAHKIPFCAHKIPFCAHKAVFAFDLLDVHPGGVPLYEPTGDAMEGELWTHLLSHQHHREKAYFHLH